MDNNTKPLLLPLTHYDRLLKTSPQMWEFIQKDIDYLRENKINSAIESVEVSDFNDKNVYDYLSFLINEIIEKFFDSTGLYISIEEAMQTPQVSNLIQTTEYNYYSILYFELFGRKTFFFHNELSNHLIATELNISSEFLKLPFDSCLFVYTAPIAVEKAFAFMNHQIEPADLLSPISVHLTTLPDKTAGGDKKLIMVVSHWRGNNCNFIIKREVAIRPNWDIEKSLKTDWEELGEKNNLEGLSDEDFYMNDGLALFRLILNSILYLSSNDPDIINRISGREIAIDRANTIKSKLKSKKARQLAQKESILDFMSLGENIRPIYISKNDSQNFSTNSSYSFKEYAYRFLVRGHWRNQPCGQNKMEKKLIWIKPYYKGSDMAELVNRPYIVQ
jgi:hypothetical protein